MGLDIYVHKTKDFKRYQQISDIEVAADDVSNNVWENMLEGRKYDELSEVEKKVVSSKSETAKKKYLTEKGISFHQGDYFTEVDCGDEEVRVDSSKYPEHLFKVGYFRSSYNETGINNFLKDRLGFSLHDIFGKNPNSEDDFVPNWKEVKENAAKTKDQLQKYFEKNGHISVMALHLNEFNLGNTMKGIGLPTSKKEALEVFNEEKKRAMISMGAYENSKGSFYFDAPLKVLGFLHGAQKRYFVEEFLPCSYIIFEEVMDDDMSWYVKALEIIIETCELILADKEHTYFLVWSG